MMDIGRLEGELPEGMLKRFRGWESFLLEEVDFTLKDSPIHTYGHCTRVLLFGLMIASGKHLSEDETEALCAAAVFHDSRRQDDWLDVGHGARAAENYKKYCEDNGLAFDKRSYLAMAYHDRDDADGMAAIRNDAEDPESAARVYRALKDADGLDRFRLGPHALDPMYLRTETAKGLVGLSGELNGQQVHER